MTLLTWIVWMIAIALIVGVIKAVLREAFLPGDDIEDFDERERW